MFSYDLAYLLHTSYIFLHLPTILQSCHQAIMILSRANHEPHLHSCATLQPCTQAGVPSQTEAGNSFHFLRVGHHLEWRSPADHPTGKPELAVECKGSVDKAS